MAETIENIVILTGGDGRAHTQRQIAVLTVSRGDPRVTDLLIAVRGAVGEW